MNLKIMCVLELDSIEILSSKITIINKKDRNKAVGVSLFPCIISYYVMIRNSGRRSRVAAPPLVCISKRPYKMKLGISKQISVFVKYGNYLLINLLYLASKHKDYVILKKYYSA